MVDRRVTDGKSKATTPGAAGVPEKEKSAAGVAIDLSAFFVFRS